MQNLDRLCYGVYLQILIKNAKKAYNKKRLSLLLLQASQNESAPEQVYRIDHDYFSPLLNCKASLTAQLIEHFMIPEVSDALVSYFEVTILPALKDIGSTVTDVYELLENDEHIRKIAGIPKQQYLSEAKTMPPQKFLGEVFYHAVTEVDNMVGRETIEQKYFDYKKSQMETADEKGQQKQKVRLHRKRHYIAPATVVIEKSNMAKFAINLLIRIVKTSAAIIVFGLASIGLLCLIYPETRNALFAIFNDTFNQLKILIGHQ